MGTAILWLSSLALPLLVVAFIMALTAKIKRFHIGFILTILSALVPLIAGVGATVFAYKWSAPKLPWLFGYTLSWTLVYFFGAVVILRCGTRLREQESSACSWPKGKLAVSFVAALVLCLCILLMLNNTANIKLSVIRSDAVSIALTLQPSQVPDHLNASLVYGKAFEAMGKMKWPDWMRDVGEPAFDLSKNEIQEFLKEEKEAIALLQRAASMPGYYSEINYLKGEIPHLISFKDAANLLSLNARLKAEEGEMQVAFENISAIRGMADHLKTIPSIMTSMMSAAIQDAGTRTAENILSRGRDIPSGALEQSIDNAVDLRQAFNEALRMEEAFMAFTSVSYLSTNSLDSWCPVAELLYRALLLYDELVSARKIMIEANAIVTRPYWESVDDWEAWEQSGEGFRGFITAIAMPSYGRGMEIKILAAEAGGKLTNLALAAYAYKADHGAYPDKIEALTPRYITVIPVDPFSGGPLKLASVQGGLMLYSVGPDLKDDGGINDYGINPENRGINQGDIAFVMGSAFEDRRLKPSKESLEKRVKKDKSRPKK
jgi:hypothetical protein